MFREGRLVQKNIQLTKKNVMFLHHFLDENQAKTDRKKREKRSARQKLMKAWSLGPLFGPRVDF